MFDLTDIFRYFFQLPKNPSKDWWGKVFTDMAVHTRKLLPKELLLKRRPNEEEDIYNYRLCNYEPITYGSMNKAIDDIFRILTAVSYTIKAPDDFKQYLTETNFSGFVNDTQNESLTLELLLQKIVLKRMIEDPNGFLIWLPVGDGLTNNAVAVDVTPKLVYNHKFYYSDANVFIYLSDELSVLMDGKKASMTGEVYYIFTKTEFWKMYQTGTVKAPKWKQELIYTHNLGEFPVVTLGGDMNSDGYYDSYFSPYLAYGNEAIRQFSDWQAVMTTSSFPYIEEFANECTFEVVNKNSINIPPQEETFTKDIKLVPLSKSPYNVTLRKIPSGNVNEDILDPSIPGRRFISPNIDIAKYSGEAWQLLIEKAEKALNIDVGVGVSQSGKAKLLDKEAQYSMITKIGNNYYDNIYLKSLRIIYAYKNNEPIGTEIAMIKPTTFWVKNEADLTEEINTLKTNNAPSCLLAQTTLDLAKKRFAGDPVSAKIFTIISLYDPLYIYAPAEKNMMVIAGVVDKPDYTKSIYMFNILHQIALEKSSEEFINMENQKIYDDFVTRVTPLIPVPPPPVVVQNFGAGGK